ncbi:DUF1476 domain-containing protein [Rhizobium setariae]
MTDHPDPLNSSGLVTILSCEETSIALCAGFWFMGIDNSVRSPRFSGDKPMSGLTDREKAFENKYAHDQDKKFRIIARRNKLLGLWASALLGKTDADAYAKEVIAADFEEAGDEDVIRKVAGDLSAAGLPQGADDVRAKLAELLPVAAEQIENS